MKRLFENELKRWKARPNKKPLVIYGARQVGKTTTVRDFARENYDNVVEINFVERPDLMIAFEGSLEPETLFANIQALTKNAVTQGTCLFLDEVQECENAISALKFLNNNKAGVDVIAAGSTLGVHIARSASFPVGNVTLKRMGPMNFEEFCLATSMDSAFELVKTSFATLDFCAAHELMLQTWRKFLLVGGMPEAVKAFAKAGDVNSVQSIQDDINTAYMADMAKYIQNLDTTKVIDCWKSVPSQLAKENESTKFAWKNVGSGASKRSHGSAVDWLVNAGMVNRLNMVTCGASPLASFENRDAFKIYMSDTGLLSRMYRAKMSDFEASDNRTARFRGGIVENFVMQEFVASGVHPFYWGVKSKHEVDFVVSAKDEIVPIEVKSSAHTKATSATYFAEKYGCTSILKLSTKNFGESEGVKSIPIYAAGLIRAE